MNGKNYNVSEGDYFSFPDIGKYEVYVLVDTSRLTSLYFAFIMPELI